ncbi:pyrroloquinoline quinone biosynthesis protein PqqE [Phaeobacter gallaeciensis]|uniref:pyrroloquinoline quinone biosynthesis protein PqqE n=1 Tax=Phaeobacter gallaeciensis TaxID=60890 RepID=UPI000BBBE342|nr:pyrroloquinoline quinone biosynthesis protein PqqE [Phaeobacter gallaeciensis]ATF20347.1 coenzyme PQQ biosynthesis enzyme PqqE [Phaeobacter gallaeciensis]ATF24456.1 coenzyme PQQ biosynthesis enzyme PqqE [Phaeobacter gallaeciensis]
MSSRIDAPMAMLAELTHRCPLACPYCSNPTELLSKDSELSTQLWGDIFQQAAALGVLQLHLSGGEPASRRDLVELVVAARKAGLYTNLITSGIGLTEKRLHALDDAGLDHVQLSLQGVTATMADRIGGYKGGFARKMHVAEVIANIGFPLTLNAVMHRANLDDLSATIDMAQRLGARRIEIACVQFQGWALRNRASLQPSRDQVEAAKATVAKAVQDLRGDLVIDFVPPDYYSDFPKACMNGWGSTGLNITPDGTVLPCHAAETIPHLQFENVQNRPLSEIWYKSAAFNAYRGTGWMPELCQSCERRDIDFAGCRCQAMAILGDPAATDPVCRKSPGRVALDALLEKDAHVVEPPEYVYRR